MTAWKWVPAQGGGRSGSVVVIAIGLLLAPAWGLPILLSGLYLLSTTREDL